MGTRHEYYKDGNLVEIVDTREVNDEKAKMNVRMRREANEILAKTDWYVSRKYERGKEIPENIANQRADVIKIIEANEEKLTKVSTLQEFDTCGLIPFEQEK
jgi:hypothetical protein